VLLDFYLTTVIALFGLVRLVVVLLAPIFILGTRYDLWVLSHRVWLCVF